eukprot:CAMPEP_0204292466 /NCGR_PEP_ID=MMETSP0468-20130131/64398_1 /ASSEMBLY_ACC=CAM_ASM_000383 /TAXON_ID=2969 /ORGANISM="Oxyrrhis marina" /LENGTH=52 /DNA_ID=CAMNT_0051270857 /DNA_START=25 /DNA_END=183 /DNA_ORIENTATION=+
MGAGLASPGPPLRRPQASSGAGDVLNRTSTAGEQQRQLSVRSRDRLRAEERK